MNPIKVLAASLCYQATQGHAVVHCCFPSSYLLDESSRLFPSISFQSPSYDWSVWRFGSSPTALRTVMGAATETAPADRQRFLLCAVLAGVFGAVSGIVGKLSVDDAWSLGAALRVTLFAANGVCTGQMWRYYLKALALGPTAVAQMLNTGANFAVSAIVGVVAFGESVNAVWFVGAALTTLGLALIAKQ